jgi:glycosyltransferase involved in cell wall biosynthesis
MIDRSLRILFVINSLGAGGAERSLVELSAGLARAGHEPIIMTFVRCPEGFEDEARRNSVAVERVPGRGVISWARSLHSRIRAIRPDVVHTAIFEADVAGRLAGVGGPAPVVSSLINVTYGPERLRDPNVRRWKLRVVREIDGWTARRLTAHFHAVSGAVRDAAVASLGLRPDRITVIERGRDPERLGRATGERRLSVRRRLGIPEDVELLLSVGRLEHQKGHLHLIDALARLSDRPRLRLLIIGRDGHMSADLRARVERLGLGDSVRFLGHRDDVPDLLVAADLLVIPSLHEGAAGVVIEAMALELPVLASDIAALREATDDGAAARLVPVGSADGIAEAVGELLEDRAAVAAMVSRGRELFERRYTLDRSVERMTNLYMSVVGRSSPVRAAVREGA